MNSTEIIFLGLNSWIIALKKIDGQILWSTSLGGMLGDGFVTIQSDGQCVYAYAKGHVCCLDPNSGRILWTNELKGFGYGIASICVPGFPSAPDPAAYARYQANQGTHTSAATS